MLQLLHVLATGAVLSATLFGSARCAESSSDGYYGKLVGKLSELHHGVSGTVYAVDARTLHIRDFKYDGEGPDAFFYGGTSKSPSGSGFRIRDEKGTLNVLKRYRGKHVTLTLPEGKTFTNIRWFSIWCREFSVNFGDVKIPKGFDFPKPHTLGALSGIHGVSSDPVVVVDAQTMLVPNFSYDGEAPDAKFWVGSGSKPSPQGIRVADENGRFTPLIAYKRKTLVITLPGSLTVHQIGHFGVWCEAFAVDFAHVVVPASLSVPPSLRMLGVSPQKPKTLDEVAQIFPISSSDPYLLDNSPNRRSFQQPARALQQISATTYKPDLQAYLAHSSPTPSVPHPTPALLQQQHHHHQQQQRPPPRLLPVLNTSSGKQPAQRPSSLNVGSAAFTPAGSKMGGGGALSEVAGVAITTPSAGIPFNFESLMEGGTGLTPVSGLAPSCSSQQRHEISVASAAAAGDLATSPDASSHAPPKLVSL